MKVVASGMDTLVIGFSVESYLNVDNFEVFEVVPEIWTGC